MRRTRSIVIAALSAFAIAGAADAEAATRYAEPGGDGPAATCPESNPCDLQVAAETNTGSGDEIVLAPGNYNLGADELEPVAGVDIGGERGAAEPARIITSATTGVFIQFSGDTLIHDVTIDHSGTFAALYQPGGAAERVFVKTTAGEAACVGSQFGVGFLRDSVCWNTSTAVGNRAGFSLETASNASVTNTYKIRNVTAVASGGGASSAYGLNVDVKVAGSGTPEQVLDARNTIALGATADVRANTGCNGPCGTGQASATATLASSNYSTVAVTGTNATVTPAGTNDNQIAEPVFADILTGDFRQDPTSPTVNEGDSGADLLGEFDILGGARIAGPAVDIGAYELDEDPPDVTLLKTPKEKTEKRKATFKFESTESATFECSIDDKAPKECGSPQKYKNVKPGKHTFEVVATDASGNEGSATYDWKVKKK